MTGTLDIRRFAFRQGPGKRYLGEQGDIDDAELTASLVPPATARGILGAPLPLSSRDTLADVRFPDPVTVAPAERLGQLLLLALGLQRREPDNRHNDHRAVASGRAKFPVHVFVQWPDRLAYLDLYRHALIDAGPRTATDPGVTLLLAARYADLPSPYGRLRYAVGEAELGVTLRAVATAADVLGVEASATLTGPRCRAAAAELAATGPGVWSAPVLLDLIGLPTRPALRTLPGAPRPVPDAVDRLLAGPPSDSITESATVSAARLDPPATPPGRARALPTSRPHPDPDGPGPSWAEVLWTRSAGRVPERLWGFAFQPAPVPAAALPALLAWAAVPPPLPIDLADRLRSRVVLRGVTGFADGVYRLDPGTGTLTLQRKDSRVFAAAQAGFGQPPAPDTDSGLRHACLALVVSADVDKLLTDLGPVGLSLVNLWCGWTSHGLCLAAAAAGLAARPARSYDEHTLAMVLDLPRGELPVFLTVCGHSRLTGPALDLRP